MCWIGIGWEFGRMGRFMAHKEWMYLALKPIRKNQQKRLGYFLRRCGASVPEVTASRSILWKFRAALRSTRLR